MAAQSGKAGESKCPAEASGQGMASRGSSGMGLNPRGGIMQIKPILVRDLKLEETQLGGKDLNYKNLKV